MGHLADEAHRLWASIVNKAAMRDLPSVRGGGRGGVLPKYLIGVNYTLDDVKGLKAEGGSARGAAATALIEGLGGTVESFYFAFGDTDVYLIVDMPDTASVAAAATARCPTPSDAPAHWSASSRIRWPRCPNAVVRDPRRRTHAPRLGSGPTIGADQTLDAELVASVWALLEPMAGGLESTGAFGSAASGNVPDSAPLQTRLFDLSGHRP